MAKAAVIATNGGNGPNCTPASPSAGGPEGDCRQLVRRVGEALRERLGEERYAVWFGDAVAIDVAIDGETAGADGAAGGCIVVSVGNAFSQEWLKRTFHGDVEAAVQAVCDGTWSVVWRTSPTRAAEGPAAPPAKGMLRPVADSRSRDAVKPRRTGASGHTLSRAQAVEVTVREKHGCVAARRPVASLEAFVAGPSNRMAFAAIEMAASRPGEMSPLVIHGPSGVGKSHLLFTRKYLGRKARHRPDRSTTDDG
jgi:chromosomal replication initiator protein